MRANEKRKECILAKSINVRFIHHKHKLNDDWFCLSDSNTVGDMIYDDLGVITANAIILQKYGSKVH